MTLLKALEREARILATRCRQTKLPRSRERLAARSDALFEAATRLRAEAARILAAEQEARDTNRSKDWADAALEAQMFERINGGPVEG